jgi:hypothetical protein
MDKVLLAIALISTLSTPAMAALTKAQGGLDTRHIQSIYQHQERWNKTSNRLRRSDVNDPYWTPCDYSPSYGTDSCE